MTAPTVEVVPVDSTGSDRFPAACILALVGFPWVGLVWLRLLPHAIKLRGSNKLQTNKYNRQNG
jgi:hypothetical protein